MKIITEVQELQKGVVYRDTNSNSNFDAKLRFDHIDDDTLYFVYIGGFSPYIEASGLIEFSIKSFPFYFLKSDNL